MITEIDGETTRQDPPVIDYSLTKGKEIFSLGNLIDEFNAVRG